MTTHDFRPGDVVEFGGGLHKVHQCGTERVSLLHEASGTLISVDPSRLLFRSRPDADPVDHPAHYTDHPSGVECITVTEHMNFNVGNAVKYLWRAGRKGDALTDLRKAAWYVNREIERLTREAGS